MHSLSFINTAIRILFISIGFGLLSHAQEISGRVVDSGSNPLLGVDILVKGTTRGTQTDLDGRYRIRADEGSILVFSFLGMVTQEIRVKTDDTIDVQMSGDISDLEEVIVLGYGETTKKSATGSVTKVGVAKIATKNVSNITQALAGEVAGVRVFPGTGQPGSAPAIRIRGFGSINGNQAPLYVLNGIPYVGNISDIDVSDLGETVVLKDAASTAIYGSRGANGVILMSSRRGRGKKFVNVKMRTGFNAQLIPRYSVIRDPDRYIGLSWEALYNKGVISGESSPEQYANDNLFGEKGISPKYNYFEETDVSKIIDPETRQVRDGLTRRYTPEDWRDYARRYGPRQEVHIGFGEGNENTGYYTSFGYLNDQGYMIKSGFRRFTASLNVHHKIKDWLYGFTNMYVLRASTLSRGQSSDSGSMFWFMDVMPPIYPLFERDDDGDFIKDIYGGNKYDYGEGRGFGALTNAIGGAYYSYGKGEGQGLNASAGLNIKPFDGFTVENRLGITHGAIHYRFMGSPYYGGDVGQGGSIYRSDNGTFYYDILTLLRYKNKFGHHNFEVSVAHEFDKYQSTGISAKKTGLAVPFIPELNNAVVNQNSNSFTSNKALESYFTQIKYDYASQYFASVSFRRDGSSTFFKNRWGNFGSLGLSWIPTNGDILKGWDIIKFLKLKASYGVVAGLSLSAPFRGYDEYDLKNLDGKVAFEFSSKGDPNVTWEPANSFQGGVDFSIKQFLDVNLEYYYRLTNKLLYPRSVGSSSGYSSVTVNEGILHNSGLDFDITGHIINTRDFTFDMSVNGQAFAKSTIDRLPIDPGTGKPKVLDTGTGGVYGRSAGKSIYDFYIREWAGVDPKTGAAQWMQYYDDKNSNNAVDKGEGISSLTEYLSKNEDAKVKSRKTFNYSDATRKYIGKTSIPIVTGGLNADLWYKGISLRLLFNYGIGGYSYDWAYSPLMGNGNVGNNNWSTDILRRWQKKWDVTDIPRISSSATAADSKFSSSSTRFLIPSDYLQLSNVSLGYGFPESITKRLKMSSLYIALTGNNLYYISHRKGFIPSRSNTGESSIYQYAPLSTFSLGITAGF